MSASREKKTRGDDLPQAPTTREQKLQQQAKEDRRTKIFYSVVGVVCAVLALSVIVWRSGIIQRTATAVTVKDTSYTAADMQYYFNTARTSTLNYYYSYLGMYPFDHQTSTKGQVYNTETGETWYDILLQQAMDTMTNNTAIAAKAKAEGYTLSEEGQQTLDQVLESIDKGWVGTNYTGRDAYLRANYGPFISYNRFVELVNQDVLASDYANAITQGFTYVDSDYQTYYTENANDLDSYTLSQFVVQATVETTDAQGNTIEMSEEETAAALEQAKAEKKPLAEEIQAKLNSGADVQAVLDEYQDQLSSNSLHQSVVGSSLNSTYSDWAKEPARKSGDVTLTESESGSSCYYYVVVFEGRQRDDSATANVRHVLVGAEQDEGATEPTQAQYDAAKAEAEQLLAQWKAGGATEDAFATLAQENSADTGSATNGGLIANISASSGYVPTFTDWAMDPIRKTGDTGIVQNTGSSTKGWHIMYYVSDGEPVWQQTAQSALRSKDYEAWETAAKEGYEATTGFGMQFISA